jgi:osmotically-inducible protein OsmY
MKAMTPTSRPHPMLLLVAALTAATLLAGCAPLLIGGALLGGSMVAIDRRTSGTQIDDQTIELKSVNRVAEVVGGRGHVSVTSYNRLVLITGEVPTEADRTGVEAAVARIDNVRSVVNELVVGSVTSLVNRSNDTLLTSKVKASMVDAKDVLANSYKVVTARGVVYLMGRVTEREAKRGTDIARGVSGVRKVVRVFDIVSEAELATGDMRPAASAAP